MVKETQIEAIVSTGKPFFKTAFDGKILKIETKSIAQKGKANKELLKELKKKVGAKIFLISGKSSRKKRLLIEADKATIKQKLT